jgi:sacsin
MRESHSSETRVAAEFDHDIKSISLWPTANAKLDTLLSSNNAFIAEHGELVVPWIKFYDRFVSPSRLELWDESMKFLQVLQIDTATLIQRILPLPPSISTSDWGRYKPIIATIAKYSESETNWEKVRVLLQNSNIAVDGNKAITHVRSLYDGHDQIFIAAFRGEEATKFLHPTVDKFKKFWLRAGLRHRKNEYLAPKDFLECLTSIATRLLGLWDVALELDISVVLGPLTSPSSSTDAFNSRTWKDISTKKVFGSNSTFVSQPPFRRSCMASVATETRVLSLSEVVSSQYVAVCWSQIPFPVHKPSKEVFHKIGTAGKPPAKMVWKHLVHLHSICPSLNVTNVRDFLSDLNATYAYLQDNVEETVSKFDYRTLPLFLNSISLDERGTTLVEVQSSWVDIEHLVLSSSCDAGLVQAVRPGLKRYEKLLKRLGCRAIVYPTGTRMNPPSTLGISNGHCGMKGLQNMREKQEGFDVTFHTEGREIKAHRLVLANVSDKWRRQFFGHFFTESVFTFYSGNKEDFLTYDALLTIIKYAYQEPIDESKLRIGEDDADDVKAKKLNVLLDLYKAAHFQLIETLANYVQYMIMVAIDMVINIDNVEEIQDKANSAGAAKVEEYCVSFYQENSETLGYKK